MNKPPRGVQNGVRAVAAEVGESTPGAQRRPEFAPYLRATAFIDIEVRPIGRAGIAAGL
jgi:hypothetical protein